MDDRPPGEGQRPSDAEKTGRRSGSRVPYPLDRQHWVPSKHGSKPNRVVPTGGEARDQAGERRDRVSHERDLVADRRDLAGEQRDQVGDERDQTAHDRDEIGDERDRAADQRDQVAEDRDEVAHLGDDAADRRDYEAERSEAEADITSDAHHRLSSARREAASDRRRASQDRGAGARERTKAELDRHTALADRGAGASERIESERDRDTAHADRGASAQDRESSSHDGLTGVYLRGPGFVELARDVARARRTGLPLVLAFVDVDGLKALNDSHGHATGDRQLLDVAKTLRSKLRTYDLIIRYGGDEFVCVIVGLDMPGATTRLALANSALAHAHNHGSITVGIAELGPDDSPESLLDRADADLVSQKAMARSRSDGPETG